MNKPDYSDKIPCVGETIMPEILFHFFQDSLSQSQQNVSIFDWKPSDGSKLNGKLPVHKSKKNSSDDNIQYPRNPSKISIFSCTF